MSDLIERLRAGEPFRDATFLDVEAADEIERLTERIAELELHCEVKDERIGNQSVRIAELEAAISGGIPSEMIAALKGDSDEQA